MKRTGVVVALVAALAAALTAGASGARSTVTVAQLKSGFKKATGQTLVADRALSSPGHYTAFNLGVQTKTRQARYGTFTIYLVSGADVATEVQGLLRNPHTGQVDPPSTGGIYWEQNQSMTGTSTWTAKRPYGANVVIWWTTAASQKKTDRTWKTLHKALTAVTKKG